MQIHNQLSANQVKTNEQPLELKQGELYKAKINRRISNKEAILQIRGKDVKATFENRVPQEDRVTVQITGQKEQIAVVKTIATEPAKSNTMQTKSMDEKVLQSVGITAKDVPELKQSVQMLLEKGLPATKETVQELREFFEKAQGSAADKLDTVKALINKRLEITQSHLRPIHETLHGKPIHEVLTNLVKEIDSEFQFGQKETTKTGDQLANEMRTKANQAELITSSNKGVSQTESQNSKQSAATTELLQKYRISAKVSADLQTVIEKVRSEIVKNPAFETEQAQKVQKATVEAEKLQAIGKNHLIQGLKNAEEQIKQSQNGQRASEELKQLREQVQKEPSLQNALKKVQSVLTTNKTIDPDIVRNLERIANQTNQLEQASRDRITKAIEQVEKVIKASNASSKSQMDAQKTNQQVPVQSERNGYQQGQETPTQFKRDASQQKKGPSSHIRNDVHQPRQQESNQLDEGVISRQKILTQQSEVNAATQMQSTQQSEPNKTNTISNEQQSKLSQLQQKVALHQQNEKISSLIHKNQIPVFNDQKNNIAIHEGTFPTETEEKIPQTTPSLMNETKQQQTFSIWSSLLTLDAEQTNENSPSEIIKQMISQIQKESNLGKALNLIQQELSRNDVFDNETTEKVEQAITRSMEFLDKGRELRARQLVTNTLTEIEQNLDTNESSAKVNQPIAKVQEALLKQLDQNVEFQTMPLETKNILVTRVTQKLAEATHDFRQLKREITKNLDTIDRLIQTFKKNAYPQVKQLVESAIKTLDNTILKSDMMLFTDMKTEKQLMQASTQLADAKKQLAKGNHAEAAKTVQDVKNLLDKINFKPTDQKVMHFVTKESTNTTVKSPQQQLLQQWEETTQSPVKQEPTARHMYDMIRSFGLNHDSDLAKSLVFQKEDATNQSLQEQQNNLKATLMKLAQNNGDETNAKIAQQAEQALNNLTGQQLLSKSDASNSLQNMFFNLPVLIGEKPENLQVYVQSKKEGQQVDWENCNLYFLIETKKLGDVGIMLSSTERNLSITIKNDMPGFQQKMEPIASITKEKLKEIGYQVKQIQFSKMTVANTDKTEQPFQRTDQLQEKSRMKPVFTEKGMDFKI